MFNSEGIKDLFDDTYETDALIIKPATDEEIARCNGDLADILRSGGDYIDSIRPGAKTSGASGTVLSIPESYAEFLKISNGYAWNGFEFFGIYQTTVKASGYTLPDLITMNEKYHNDKMGLDDMIVLGRFDDDIYVYNFKESEYQALDSLTLSYIDSFEGFDDLFICYVSMYTDEEDYIDDDNIIEDDGNADQ